MRLDLFLCVRLSVCVCSQQPIPERLQIRVNRISMAAYEALHYDKDQLKEACESHHTHSKYNRGTSSMKKPA